MASVAVVGAGISGLSSAVCILEKDPRVKVTLIADTFSPETTSDGAAGLILPYEAGKTSESLQRYRGIEHHCRHAGEQRLTMYCISESSHLSCKLYLFLG